MKKITLVTLAVVGLLAGCKVRNDPEVPFKTNDQELPQQNDRFIVERVGIFNDYLAYDGQRGVYVITDKQTGQEFIGVSGIGISELGSHTSGKTSVSDER